MFMAGAALLASPLALADGGIAERLGSRKHHPMALAMWSPPPNDVSWIDDEANLGTPGSPFVFQNDTLYARASFVSTREMQLRTTGRIYVYGDAVVEWAGPIPGTRPRLPGLLKMGSGTLVLSGENSYGGPTTLAEGTLHLVGGSPLGEETNTVAWANGTVLSLAPGVAIQNTIELKEYDWSRAGLPPSLAALRQVPADYADRVRLRVDVGEATLGSEVLGESTRMVKQGQGRLRLTGVGRLPLPLEVDEGAVSVEGHYPWSVSVASGARLEGIGTVDALRVGSGGIVAPGRFGVGARVGTLTVQRSAAFEPGSRLQIRLLPSGESDLLLVHGKALLDGDVLALAGDGDWQPGMRYTILHADEGFGGSRFASVATDTPTLATSLSYDETRVYLTLADAAVAREEEGPSDSDRDVPALEPPATGSPAPSVLPSLNDADPWAASLLSMLADDSRFIREAMLSHAGAALSGPRDLGRLFWRTPGRGTAVSLRAFHSSADRGARQGIEGDSRDVHGLVLGMDQAIGRNWSLGAYVGAQRTDGRRGGAARADARVDTTHVGASLASHRGPLELIAGVAYSGHRVRSHRHAVVQDASDFLSSRYRASTVQVFGEAGVPLGQGWTPFARLAWLKNRADGYAEQGAQQASSFASASQTLVLSQLGLRAVHAIDTPTGAARLRAEVAWRHAAGDLRAVTTQRQRNAPQAAVQTADGLPIARNALSIGLGLAGRLDRRTTVSLSYGGQFGAGARDHGLGFDVAIAF